MAIRKIIFPLITLVTFTCTVFSQQKVQELKIGDKLPDMLIDIAVNKEGKSIQLKDLYKEGPLIIDFWATWCVPCIHEMSFLDSLKREHPSKFNVLMVTQEKESTVNRFFKRPVNHKLQSSSLYFTIGDSVLKKLFPHNIVPHNIWINKNGVIKAITSIDEMTSENILAFIESDEIIPVRTKKDNFTFKGTEEFHLGDSIFTYRSIITPYIPGVNGGSRVDHYSGKVSKFFQYNGSILHLYWNAYSKFNTNLRYNLMELHAKDSVQFFYPTDRYKYLFNQSKYMDQEEWREKNSFCYSLTLPNRVDDTVFRNYMFDDLHRQFNYLSAKIENRNIPCIIVTKTKGNMVPKKAIDTSSIPNVRLMASKIRIRNAHIKEVLDHIYRFFTEKSLPEPFISQIPLTEDYRFDADLEFSNDAIAKGMTPQLVFAQLEKLGFRFTRKINAYPILVIKDNR